MKVAEYTHLVLLMLLPAQGYGHILRLPCKRFADFRAIQKNHVLEDGWVIRTIENTNVHRCRYACLKNSKCKSFNFHNDGSACQLNSQSAEDQQDGVITVPRAGWTYHSTIYNDALVGQNCRRRNPCPGKRCIDTCGYPGYQCSGTMIINIPTTPPAPVTTVQTTTATTKAPMTTQVATEAKETAAKTQAPATTNAPMTTQVATEAKKAAATTQAPATTNAPMTTQVATEAKEAAATTQAPATTNAAMTTKVATETKETPATTIIVPLTTQVPIATQEPETEPTATATKSPTQGPITTATTNVPMTTEAPTATQKPTEPKTATATKKPMTTASPTTSTYTNPCKFGFCPEQPEGHCRPSKEDKHKAEFYLHFPAIDKLPDFIIKSCGTECKDTCSRVAKPYCGTDGRTYLNLCVLNYTKCKKQGQLGLSHKGKCQTVLMSSRTNGAIRPPKPG